jgi:hypothetical protein
MQDAADKKTGDLLRSPGAKRQAQYRARKVLAGMRQRLVWMDDGAWQAGFNAGLAGMPNTCLTGLDQLSFVSGYIEGQAKAAKTA